MFDILAWKWLKSITKSAFLTTSMMCTLKTESSLLQTQQHSEDVLVPLLLHLVMLQNPHSSQNMCTFILATQDNSKKNILDRMWLFLWTSSLS